MDLNMKLLGILLFVYFTGVVSLLFIDISNIPPAKLAYTFGISVFLFTGALASSILFISMLVDKKKYKEFNKS